LCLEIGGQKRWLEYETKKKREKEKAYSPGVLEFGRTAGGRGMPSYRPVLKEQERKRVQEANLKRGR